MLTKLKLPLNLAKHFEMQTKRQIFSSYWFCIVTLMLKYISGKFYLVVLLCLYPKMIKYQTLIHICRYIIYESTKLIWFKQQWCCDVGKWEEQKNSTFRLHPWNGSVLCSAEKTCQAYFWQWPAKDVLSCTEQTRDKTRCADSGYTARQSPKY